MELYFAYPSTYSQKVLLGLYEKNVPFTPKLVNLSDPEEKARYREFYPMGKIPLLVRDDQRMIPESSIILEYIDNAFPESPRLINPDPELGRQTRFLDRMCDLYLNDTVVSLIFESFKPEEERSSEMMEGCSEQLAVMYGYLNDQLKERAFLAGDAFTLADCAAMPPLFYARNFADFSPFPNIEAYWARVSQRPAWVKLMQEAAPAIKAILGD